MRSGRIIAALILLLSVYFLFGMVAAVVAVLFFLVAGSGFMMVRSLARTTAGEER